MRARASSLYVLPCCGWCWLASLRLGGAHIARGRAWHTARRQTDTSNKPDIRRARAWPIFDIRSFNVFVVALVGVVGAWSWDNVALAAVCVCIYHTHKSNSPQKSQAVLIYSGPRLASFGPEVWSQAASQHLCWRCAQYVKQEQCATDLAVDIGRAANVARNRPQVRPR